MKNLKGTVWLGALLVIMGVVFLLQNFGLFGGVEQLVWVVLFGLAGLSVESHVMAGKRQPVTEYRRIRGAQLVERVAGAHLFDVRGGVKAVAFNGRGTVQAAESLADAGLATAGNTHDDQGGNRLSHETPQDADSATFARCKASAKTGFSRAILSFFME